MILAKMVTAVRVRAAIQPVHEMALLNISVIVVTSVDPHLSGDFFRVEQCAGRDSFTSPFTIVGGPAGALSTRKLWGRTQAVPNLDMRNLAILQIYPS